MEFFIASCLAPWIAAAVLSPLIRKKSGLQQTHQYKTRTLCFVVILPILFFAVEYLQKNPVLTSFFLFSEFILLNWLASLASHPGIKYFRGRSLFITQPILNLFAIAMVLYLSPRFTHASWVWLCVIGHLGYRLYQTLSYREDYELMRQKIISTQSEALNSEIVDFVSRQKNSYKKVS